MALKDTWIDRVNGVSDVLAEDPNEIAHAVIELEKSTANALIGEKSGNSITFDDISPLQGTLKVSVESKNIVPTSYYHSKVTTIRGVTCTTNDDGSITLNGKYDGTGDISFFLARSTTDPFIIKKGIYIGSTGVANANLSYKILNGGYGGFGTPATFDKDTPLEMIYVSMLKNNVGIDKEFNGETIYPMIMRGTTCEAYTEPTGNGHPCYLVRDGQDGSTEIRTAVGEIVEFGEGDFIEQGTTIFASDAGVAFHAEYNKDINKAFAELQQAIISLGGNI